MLPIRGPRLEGIREYKGENVLSPPQTASDALKDGLANKTFRLLRAGKSVKYSEAEVVWWRKQLLGRWKESER